MKVQKKQFAWQDEKLLDFRSFLYLTWKHLNLPEPTAIQYDIANVFQQLVLTGNSRAVIMAPRAVGKSWIASTGCVWAHYWWPNWTILVESAAKPRAVEFSKFCRGLIRTMPQLAALTPGDNQTDRDDEFVVGPAGLAHSSSLRAVGIDGQKTGARSDLIVPDDVEIDSNCDTDIQRGHLKQACLDNDAICNEGGSIIYLGTAHSRNTTYKVLEAAGYKLYVWTARYPDARLRSVHTGERRTLGPMILNDLARDPSLVGKPTGEPRHGEDYLQQREARGRSWFALQYMQDTSLADASRFPLKLADLIVDDLDLRFGAGGYVWSGDPEYELRGVASPGLDGDHFHRPWQKLGTAQPYQGIVVHVDPGGRGTNETAAMCTGVLNGNVFLFDFIGVRGGATDENLISIVEMARLYKASSIIVEPNFGDGTWAQLLKPVVARLYPCSVVDGERAATRKEPRIIAALEPLMNQHRLIVSTKVVHKDASRRVEDGDDASAYSLFHQMTNLTDETACLRFDDRIDALGQAAKYWIESLGIDQHTAMERHERDLAEKELEEMMRALGPNAFLDPKKHKPEPQGYAARLFMQRDPNKDPRDFMRNRALGRLPADRPRGPVTVGVALE